MNQEMQEMKNYYERKVKEIEKSLIEMTKLKNNHLRESEKYKRKVDELILEQQK